MLSDLRWVCAWTRSSTLAHGAASSCPRLELGRCGADLTGFRPNFYLQGRWKILHNLMRQSSFTDVFVGCGIATQAAEASIQTADGRAIGGASPLCYLRNDTPDRFVGVLTVSLIALGTGDVTPLASIPASIAAIGDEGAGSVRLFCPDGTALLGASVQSATECGTFDALLQSAPDCDPTSCYLDVRVAPASSSVPEAPSADKGGVLHGHNELLLAAPAQLKLPAIKLKVEAATQASEDDGSVAVTVTADAGGVAACVLTYVKPHLTSLFLLCFAPGSFRFSFYRPDTRAS